MAWASAQPPAAEDSPWIAGEPANGGAASTVGSRVGMGEVGTGAAGGSGFFWTGWTDAWPSSGKGTVNRLRLACRLNPLPKEWCRASHRKTSTCAVRMMSKRTLRRARSPVEDGASRKINRDADNSLKCLMKSFWPDFVTNAAFRRRFNLSRQAYGEIRGAAPNAEYDGQAGAGNLGRRLLRS